MQTYKDRIKVLFLDIDGVFTNGKKIYDLTFNVVGKEFYDKDLTALNYLKDKYKIIFVSGDDRINREFARRKDIQFIHEFRSKKDKVLMELTKLNLSPEEVIYVGDDLVDLECIKSLPYTICPLNSLGIIKKHAHIVCPVNGGEGVLVWLYEYLLGDYYG